MQVRNTLSALTLVASAILGATGIPAAAQQTITSKVEFLGAPESLQFTGLRMREQNGLLQVQAEVTNPRYFPQTAYYRVKWMDDAGFQVWDDEAWKPLPLNGEQKLTLQMVAPTTKARDFMIQFSAADNQSKTGNNGNTSHMGPEGR